MTDILLGIGVATFIIYTAFHIQYMLSVKRTSDNMTKFFESTEGNLNKALEELKDTLENMKKITGNVHAVTEDVRQIADAAARVERRIQGLSGSVKEVLGTRAEANMAGLKAGIRTGVVTLVKNLREGRRDDHERGARKEGR